MMISSLSRTERTADLSRIFKARRNLNRSELDSHADTCVAGANTRVMDYTDTKVSVSPKPSRMFLLPRWQRLGTIQLQVT
jgi:hypothetical protein